MRETNDRLGAFRYRLPLQVDHTVLGHQIHYIGSRRCDDVPGRKRKYDTAAALASLIISGRKADERLASLGRIRAAHELQLPSRAADVAKAVRFLSHLALQIDLRG